MIDEQIKIQTLGFISQIVFLNCSKYFSNGETKPLVLKKTLNSIREILIRNDGNSQAVEQSGYGFILLFKFGELKSDPELVQVFTRTMLSYMKQLTKIWTFVQPSKLFTFCSPSILKSPQMKQIMPIFVDIACKMISYLIRAIKDKVFEDSTYRTLPQYGGINTEQKEPFYIGQVLRVLLSAGQLGVLDSIPSSSLLEVLELIGQRIPRDQEATKFINSMYLSVLYSVKSNP